MMKNHRSNCTRNYNLLAFCASIVFFSYSCHDAENINQIDAKDRTLWAVGGDRFSRIDTNVYWSNHNDYPNTGFINIDITGKIDSNRKLRNISVASLVRCRNEFSKAFRLSRIRQGDNKSNQTIPFNVERIVLMVSASEVPPEKFNADEEVMSQELERCSERIAYHFSASEVFSKKDLESIFDVAIRVSPGWRKILTEDGRTKIILFEVPVNLP